MVENMSKKKKPPKPKEHATPVVYLMNGRCLKGSAKNGNDIRLFVRFPKRVVYGTKDRRCWQMIISPHRAKAIAATIESMVSAKGRGWHKYVKLDSLSLHELADRLDEETTTKPKV